MPKISKYTAVAAPADTDIFVVVQGGVTKKVTYAQIKAGVIGAVDAMIYKGVIACAGNPNYPAADAGHVYKVSTAGRIGGADGPVVAIGDVAICAVDGTAAGTHAAVGANWDILQTNIDIESATAANDFLVGGSSPFGWVRKTLAEIKAILGLGGTVPAPVAVNDFMVAAGSPLNWVKKTLAEVMVILGTVSSVAKSSAYTILDTDGYQTVYVSGNTVIKLPVASLKRLIRFKKTDSNATTVQIRISDTGADDIEGNETAILREPFDSVVLESNGTATWYKF